MNFAGVMTRLPRPSTEGASLPLSTELNANEMLKPQNPI
jgi:hypothetical protein